MIYCTVDRIVPARGPLGGVGGSLHFILSNQWTSRSGRCRILMSAVTDVGLNRSSRLQLVMDRERSGGQRGLQCVMGARLYYKTCQ